MITDCAGVQKMGSKEKKAGGKSSDKVQQDVNSAEKKMEAMKVCESQGSAAQPAQEQDPKGGNFRTAPVQPVSSLALVQ